MTLLEKQGPSTAFVSAGSQGEDDASHKCGSEKVQFQQKGSDMPPSYADSIATGSRSASTSAPSSRPAGPPPSNHTSIIKSNSGISGHWNVDTNLTIPEALLRPLARGQIERPNLYLHTSNASIQVTVALVSGSSQRANLEFETSNAKVAVTIVSRVNSQPIKLMATTRNAEATIALPADFVGPLYYRTKNSKVKFSEGLQEFMSTYSDECSFVGDWQAAGFADLAKWEGDEVEVETANARIQFTYYNENSRDKSKESGSPCTSGSKPKEKGGFFGRH